MTTPALMPAMPMAAVKPPRRPVPVRILDIPRADPPMVDIVVPITDRLVDFPVPLDGTLRGVEFGRDDGTLAEIVKG